MSIETKIMLMFFWMLALVMLTIGFRIWRRRKGKASIFAADRSLEDAMFSAVMSVGSGTAEPGIDGRLILRPPLGTRVLMPVIGAVVLAVVDMTQLFEAVGLQDPSLQRAGVYVLWGALAYTVVMLNFVQRVVLDGTALTSYGLQRSPQTRDLTGLVDIAMHPQRPALVLTFADQPRLYVPKVLTGHRAFVALMEEIAAGNRAIGQRARPKSLLRAVGF